jgi:hypothetical protein
MLLNVTPFSSHNLNRERNHLVLRFNVDTEHYEFQALYPLILNNKEVRKQDGFI